MPNELKNEKLRKDITDSLPLDQANLAIAILGLVESSGGNVDGEAIRKIAIKCFDERTDK
jgi:hypothetical protein